jgi:hypothetical protein
VSRRRDPESYDIGYGKPPAATQFKPGRSGNPKGRPKGSRNQQTVIAEELNRKIVVVEGGKRKKITKRAAIAKALVNKAVQGDIKAANTLLLHEARSAPPEAALDHRLDEFEEDLLLRSAPDLLRRLTDRSERGDD